MTIPYELKRSKRARRTSITVKQTGEVVVTVPFYGSTFIADLFVQQKTAWIQAMQEKLKKRFEDKTILKQTRKDYLEKKDEALDLLTKRTHHFNQVYKFTFKNITVRNQKSRWGSCSTKGNINFNYGLIYLPEHLRDYIVVHELCHLQEMNHGKRFWALVEKTIPDHKARRLELRKKFINVQ